VKVRLYSPVTFKSSHPCARYPFLVRYIKVRKLFSVDQMVGEAKAMPSLIFVKVGLFIDIKCFGANKYSIQII
jgi:hypothetical protein